MKKLNREWLKEILSCFDWIGLEGVYDFILLYFIVADSTIQAGRSMC